MTYICKTVVIVHVDGKRKEIAQGAPLPAGVDEDAMDDLIRLGAIEQDRAVLGAGVQALAEGRVEVAQDVAISGTADSAGGEASDAGAADVPPADATGGDAPAADPKPRGRRPKAD